ncbi:MAG: prenyltransferase [Betaproteobacteria bacterium]|nr:prenyltransferase [Betaproteobacteria bacterium]
MAGVEPTLSAYANPLARYFAATRPAFLSVTLIGVLLGLASAHAGGVALNPLTAFVTLAFALVAHAGINVLNDYYDALNGSDAANTERRFPFTGGSRFIQNGVISVSAMGIYGYALLAAVVPAGLWLAHASAPGLIWIGLAGLAVGWAYSAPPLKLMSRGFGEAAVACGWLIVVLGADYVQRGAFAWGPLAAGLGYALQVANLLFINQFPDVKADAAAGKRNLVVRLGPQRARWLYPAIAAAAYVWLAGAVLAGALPPLALAAIVSAFPALAAARTLARHALRPAALDPAIRATIGAALLHGALLAAALFLAR